MTSSGKEQAVATAAGEAGAAASEAAVPPRSTPLPPGRSLPAWARALLGVPLLAKIAGANGLIAVVAIAVAVALHSGHPSDRAMLATIAVAVLASLVVNLVLVHVALRPLDALEQAAQRVWRGDMAARVPGSPLADRNIARVGGAINLLLDKLAADRARVRRLAAQVVSAQDQERSRIARELHDSTAQTLAALLLQLGAAARDAKGSGAQMRLEGLRSLAAGALEEVRALSHTMHPRVLDDLGLAAALEWLARQARERGRLDTVVRADVGARGVPPATAAVLYGVAQEALRNAERHSGATTVAFALSATPTTATLQVSDNGGGFEVAEAEERRPGMGLFTMRERVALVDGRIHIESIQGQGTRVVATVPLTQEVGR